MHVKIKKFSSLTILLLLVISLLMGCTGQNTAPQNKEEVSSEVSVTTMPAEETQQQDGKSSATTARYREKEIREYKGAKLDPAIGPSDNSIKGVQHVDISTYSLKIDGLVKTPVDLKYSDVTKMDAYERKITLHCVTGWDATILWKGSLIKDIIDQAGADPKANTVIFHAVDGYTTSLPLDTIVSNQLILAYSANGLDLPAELGYPFIVVAEDKLGYKWARWVSEIELSDDPKYKGYWEQRGYSNEANLN